MKRLGHFEDGPLLTAGEKGLVVMLLAGVFGYWAGFNLSAPSVVLAVPVTSAAARPMAAEPARATLSASQHDLRPAGAATEPGRSGSKPPTL